MNQVSVCGAKLHLLPTGEQKCLEQTKRRGRRLSIIGLQPLISFVYGLVIGGVNRKSYIQIMEVEAQEAEKLTYRTHLTSAASLLTISLTKRLISWLHWLRFSHGSWPESYSAPSKHWTLNHPSCDCWNKSRLPWAAFSCLDGWLTIQTWFSSSSADTPSLAPASNSLDDSRDLTRWWFWGCSQASTGRSRFCVNISINPASSERFALVQCVKKETLTYRLPDAV